MPRHFGDKDRALPPGTNLEEVRTILAATVQEWCARQREKGLRAGLQEGHVEGKTQCRAEGLDEFMRRQAARTFDAATADQLAEQLAGILYSERLAEVGEWLLECEHAEELLQRVGRLCGTSAPGDGFPPGCSRLSMERERRPQLDSHVRSHHSLEVKIGGPNRTAQAACASSGNQ